MASSQGSAQDSAAAAGPAMPLAPTPSALSSPGAQPGAPALRGLNPARALIMHIDLNSSMCTANCWALCRLIRPMCA